MQQWLLWWAKKQRGDNMDKILKEKWLVALRSGNYRPWKNCYFLRRIFVKGEDFWSAFGVLADISGRGYWSDTAKELGQRFKYWSHNLQGGRDYQSANSHFAEVFGIPKLSFSLIEGMHHDHVKNFDEIANYIEKNL